VGNRRLRQRLSGFGDIDLAGTGLDEQPENGLPHHRGKPTKSFGQNLYDRDRLS
jgi:hypothetical protein